jgi:hypothetical protein
MPRVCFPDRLFDVVSILHIVGRPSRQPQWELFSLGHC